MMQPLFSRSRLCGQVHFTSVIDPKFIKNRISVHLMTPHGTSAAAANALVPFMLRKGCASFPDFTRLNERLCELYDAVLTADVGVVGASQTVSLSITTLDDRYALDGDRVIAACSELLCDILIHPHFVDGLFPEEDLLIERQSLLDAVDAEQNDKRRYALLRFQREMYAGEIDAVPRYGSREAVAGLTAGQVTEAWRQLLNTARVEILFVGGGDPRPARESFAAAFAADLPRDDFVRPPVHRADREPKEIVERLPVTQSKLVLGFSTGIGLDDPTSDAARLMAVLLGGTPHSLLFTQVRERLSLCYYCAARYDRLRGVLTVDCGIEGANRGAAEKAILEQVERLCAGDFADEELGAAFLSMRDSLQSIDDSLGGIESYALGRILYGIEADLAEEIDTLAAVSREQVAAAARKLRKDTVYFLTGEE